MHEYKVICFILADSPSTFQIIQTGTIYNYHIYGVNVDTWLPQLSHDQSNLGRVTPLVLLYALYTQCHTSYHNDKCNITTFCGRY